MENIIRSYANWEVIKKCFLPMLWQSCPTNGSGVKFHCSCVSVFGELELCEIEILKLLHCMDRLVLPRYFNIKNSCSLWERSHAVREFSAEIILLHCFLSEKLEIIVPPWISKTFCDFYNCVIFLLHFSLNIRLKIVKKSTANNFETLKYLPFEL